MISSVLIVTLVLKKSFLKRGEKIKFTRQTLNVIMWLKVPEHPPSFLRLSSVYRLFNETNANIVSNEIHKLS